MLLNKIVVSQTFIPIIFYSTTLLLPCRYMPDLLFPTTRFWETFVLIWSCIYHIVQHVKLALKYFLRCQEFTGNSIVIGIVMVTILTNNNTSKFS